MFKVMFNLFIKSNEWLNNLQFVNIKLNGTYTAKCRFGDTLKDTDQVCLQNK